MWNRLVPIWDDRSFYDFVATNRAFASRSFRHREVFGQVGFGTGGWDTDFPNSMLEILRVVVTNQDEDQRLIVGGVEQMPRRLWKRAPERMAHWPAGTTLERLHDGAPRPGVTRIAPTGDGRFRLVDRWGDVREYHAVLEGRSQGRPTRELESGERSLEEIERLHLNDAFWGVS